MPNATIVLVSKRPTVDRMDPSDLSRLQAAGVADLDRMQQGKDAHDAALQTVLQTLSGESVRQVFIDEVSAEVVADAHLVVSVGGDGTALASHVHLVEQELLAVNSDPSRSIGHYTRCSADGFAALFARWQAGQHSCEELARLQVQTPRAQRLILNDCLICNSNAGTMSRYVLDIDGKRERQFSSGIWVSTASGSTGAIKSAGMTPLPCQKAALLYKVREPFHGRQQLCQIEGVQTPPRGLQAIALSADLAVFPDGDPESLCLKPGESVSIRPTNQPLKLVSS